MKPMNEERDWNGMKWKWKMEGQNGNEWIYQNEME